MRKGKESMKKPVLPPLGHRIIKTAAAVLICLLLHLLTGYRGSAAQSTIAAVICMQPYLTDTKTYAWERILGTLLGSLWAFAYLGLMRLLPMLDKSMAEAYFVMSLFVVMALYSSVLLKKASTAALVVIVFLSTVVTYPEVEATPLQALGVMLDTMVGTTVAIAVNIFHLPRRKHPERLFFICTRHLVPDRYSQIPSSVHITLDYLYNDGAKICLISRWAPAFLISQMGLLNVNAPAIVMDGAGLYDMQETKYLDVIDIPKENAERLRGIIRGFGSFCSFYTVRGRSLCIFRDGPLSEAEKTEYDRMKRSPYRNYMEGSYSEEDRIAFIRVIDTPERIEELDHELRSVLPPGMFRVELRREAQFPDYRGLYFYDAQATVAEMKKRVQQYMETKYSTALTPVDIQPKMKSYSPEHDALLLLSRLKRAYEPVRLFGKKK